MKCGEIIEDGEKLCQACHQQDSSVGRIIKQKLGEMETEMRTKMGKILKDTGDETVQEVEKAFQKKTRQAVRKIMVKTGLKKETPLDKAKDMWKKIKR